MNIFGKALLRCFNFLHWNSARNEVLIIFGLIKRVSSYSKLIHTTSYMDPTVRLVGINNIYIGKNTLLSENVWLNVNHRNGFEKKIQIGNNCHIGLANYFSCGPSIVLKDYCFTGIDCHFLGSGHEINNPFVPYIASGLTEGASIEIGVNCWLTTSVTVLQGVKIGHGSVIGARSVVTSDIPPFSLAIGNPAKVIKRYDFLNSKWITITEWNENLESKLPNEIDFLNILKLKYKKLPISLLASGKRFGWL